MLTTPSATEADILYLSSRLRVPDVNEIRAASGSTPEAALLRGFKAGPSWAITAPGKEVVGVFGVVPTGPRFACVWMVATPSLEEHATSLIRQSRPRFKELSATYGTLWNWTDARNTLHHKWLTWAGCRFTDTDPVFGTEQRLFYRFEYTCANQRHSS